MMLITLLVCFGRLLEDMVKNITIVISLVFLTNCSMVWYANDSYAVIDESNQCVAPALPIILDGISTIAATTTAMLFYMNQINTEPLMYDEPVFYYTPLFMLSSAFFVSTVGGIGKAMECNRRM